MSRTYTVELIANPGSKRAKVTTVSDILPSVREAAVIAQKLAANYRRQGYSVTLDQTYADVPVGYRPYLIYDYVGRAEGRPPGRNPNYKLVYRIEVVDNQQQRVDLLFAKGILRLKQ